MPLPVELPGGGRLLQGVEIERRQQVGIAERAAGMSRIGEVYHTDNVAAHLRRHCLQGGNG